MNSTGHPASDNAMLRLSHTVPNIIVAILSCYCGTFVTLSLAKASLYVESRILRLTTGLSFVLQSVFVMYFVDMVGLDFGVPWGFNFPRALLSFALISVLGTIAIYLAISIRRDIEPEVQREFPGYVHNSRQTLAFQGRCAYPSRVDCGLQLRRRIGTVMQLPTVAASPYRCTASVYTSSPNSAGYDKVCAGYVPVMETCVPVVCRSGPLEEAFRDANDQTCH